MKRKVFNLKIIVSFIVLFTCVYSCAHSSLSRSQPQQVEVSGIITDCENNKLFWASVTAKKNIHAVSDTSGFYRIIVPDTNTVITYSFLGYQSQKIKVGNKKTIDVSLKEATPPLDTEIILVKKPVIYLYPEIDTEISLKINYNGKLSFTYPKYNDGWNVIASPDGTLKNKKDNKMYLYLFWDGEKTYNNKEVTYENGFIVHKDSVVTFFQKILPELGLKPHEYNEFIVFWTPYLMQNNWNFIHFRIGEDYNVISENIVNPTPDTEIRVFMEFKKIDKPFDIEPEKATTPVRKGFTLVEWGGAELKQPVNIKTTDGKHIKQ